jgi:lysosomal acid lipase/cholesteryl ester hydrolase
MKILVCTKALLPEIFGHLPAGTSVPSVVHYAQGVTSTSFMKYDYGPEKNLEVYGQISPPEYDLSKITAPVALYWAENDWLGAKAVRYIFILIA